ncbi:MAG: MFS transporter [Opitutaceae bacterium]|jgi:GPH family glycoside/pentoside/hexuronide:cation symporter
MTRHAGVFKHIPEADRIPFGQKLAFGAGASMSWLAADLTTGVLWMPFFNIGLGVSPVALGFVLMTLRLWDAFMDPIIGTVSDNTRTRWGRRRPFMFVGAILTAGIYLLMWRPPAGLGETGLLAYLFIVGLFFFACCTCASMPFAAMQMELTPNYDERTRLMAWTAFFAKCFNLLGGWSMAIITSSLFANAITGKPDIVRGMQAFSWLVAGLILILGLLPAIIGRERYYKKEVAHQAKEPFWSSLKESVGNGPLWALIGVAFCLMLSGVSVGALGQYVNIYYVNEGRLADASIITGWKASVLVATGIACLPMWTWLGEKFDKKTIMTAMVLATMAGHLLYIVCLRPDMPYLQILPAVFEVGTISAIWIFLPSMKADVADYDELHTTRRREGSLNAVYSWFFKIASMLALGVGGVVLQSTGFDAKLSGQSPEVLQRMVFIFIALPVAIWAVMLLCLWRYPLNRERMADIRSALEIRRGKL